MVRHLPLPHRPHGSRSRQRHRHRRHDRRLAAARRSIRHSRSAGRKRAAGTQIRGLERYSRNATISAAETSAIPASFTNRRNSNSSREVRRIFRPAAARWVIIRRRSRADSNCEATLRTTAPPRPASWLPGFFLPACFRCLPRIKKERVWEARGGRRTSHRTLASHRPREGAPPLLGLFGLMRPGRPPSNRGNLGRTGPDNTDGNGRRASRIHRGKTQLRVSTLMAALRLVSRGRLPSPHPRSRRPKHLDLPAKRSPVSLTRYSAIEALVDC